MALKTVLLMDDEQMSIEALKDALEFQGYRVLLARTVADALRICEYEQVDAVTVDLMIDPGQDFEDGLEEVAAGLYFCEKARRRYPHLKLLCLSVVSDEAVIRRIRGLGIEYFRKGEVSLKRVVEAVQDALLYG